MSINIFYTPFPFFRGSGVYLYIFFILIPHQGKRERRKEKCGKKRKGVQKKKTGEKLRKIGKQIENKRKTDGTRGNSTQNKGEREGKRI